MISNKKYPKIDNEGEPADATRRNSKQAKNKKKKRAAVITICFIASVSLLLIFLSPLTFNDLVNVDQIFCKDGSYDSEDSTERINCKG
jgi:hypothetical protein